jgi:hypothetical protein
MTPEGRCEQTSSTPGFGWEFHFRFADVDSRNLGLRLPDWTLEHHFQPIDHD